MGVARTLARRSLLQRPGRSLFATLGIALGIAIVVGLVVLDINTVLSLSRVRAQEGMADMELRPTDGTGDVAKLREMDGMSLVVRTFQNDAWLLKPELDSDSEELGSARNPGRLRLVGAEFDNIEAFDTWSLERGELPSGDNAGAGALLGLAAAEELGLDIGDRMILKRPRRLGRRECVDGKLVAVAGEREAADPPGRSFEITGILARQGVGRRAGGRVVLVDYDAGALLYPGQKQRTVFWGQRDQAVDVERFETSLAGSYSYELNQGVILGQAADERAFRTGVRMAGLLALVLGLYVIFHTLSMSLTERVREIGTLQALGASRWQVARVFLLEAIVLAGTGAVLGVLGGLGLARLLLVLRITTLGTGKVVTGFFVPWGTTLSLAGVGFVVALLGSVYPLSSLGRVDQAAALRGEHVQAGRAAIGFQLFYALLLALLLPALYFVIVPVVGEFSAEMISVLLGAVGFLGLVVLLSLVVPKVLSGLCVLLTKPFERLAPLAGRMASRTIAVSPARVGASAAALALVTAGLVGLKGMTRSLAAEVDVWAAEAVEDKVWLRGMPDVPFADLSAALAGAPDVLGIEKGNARVMVPFLLLGTDPKGLEGYGPLGEDPKARRRFENQRTLVASRRLAEKFDLTEGSSVPVTRANGDVVTFTVLAVSDAYGHWPFPDERMYGVVADRWIEKDFCRDTATVNEVSLRLAPDGDGGAAKAMAEAFLAERFPRFRGGIGLRTGAEVHAHHRADIVRDFVLFDILILLTGVLAALGVLNGMLLAALERAKEFGVLTALGASRKQIAGCILLEALVVGLVGGLLGALLGAALTPLAVGAVQQLSGLELPVRSGGYWLAVGAAGAMAVSVLAALYPIWRAGRFDPVRSVRTG